MMRERMHAASHKVLYRYYSRETGNFDIILLQIYCLTKLLQKENGAVFLTHSVRHKIFTQC